MRPVIPSTSDRGITLLELVIAVFVLAIGSLAALRSVEHAQRNLGEEPARLFAAQAALNRAQEIRLVGVEGARSLPANVQYGPYEWQLDVTFQRGDMGLIRSTVTSSGRGLPGAMFEVYTAPKVPE